jgi:hypothetical protein
MEPLDIRALSSGSGAITAEFGAAIAQAAGICLEREGHKQGAPMSVGGLHIARFACAWNPCDERMRRCWNDPEHATEHGAIAFAVLLVDRLMDLKVTVQSRKKTGFDYWVGTDGNYLFQNKARLEISGIGHGTAAQINQRVRDKLKQTEQSTSTGFEAIVVVVEFGSPQSVIART